jgi:hypothetical protein
MDWINRSIMHWTCLHRYAATFHRFLYLMMWFPLNHYAPKQVKSYLISYDFPFDLIVTAEIDVVRGSGQLFEDQITNMVSFWRYGYRLMVFSPAKVADSLDEVILTRWLVFIKEPLARCTGFHKHAYPQTITMLIYYVSLGIISETAVSMMEILFSIEALSGLFDCLAVGDEQTNVITGIPEWMAGATDKATRVFYHAMGLYLEHCAVILRIVALREPVREFEIRHWCVLKLLERMWAESTPVLDTASHSLPSVEFLRSKVRFLYQCRLDGADCIIPAPVEPAVPPPIEPVPAKGKQPKGRGKAPTPAAAPPKPPVQLTGELLEMGFRRRSKHGSPIIDSLTEAFNTLNEATTNAVLESETGIVGLEAGFRESLVKSHGTIVKLWEEFRANPTASIEFVVEIETSLYPVPVVRMGKWR